MPHARWRAMEAVATYISLAPMHTTVEIRSPLCACAPSDITTIHIHIRSAPTQRAAQASLPKHAQAQTSALLPQATSVQSPPPPPRNR
ncbi:hypothetical protein FKP32DRAFT_1596319 [Trametes sanguinea]|nr:hypothetical protein FKP32DRAFT_1596319 [Trametes sanguinea]